MPPVLACTPVHSFAGGQVRLIGACRAVTGAMSLVEAGGSRVLVDAGVPQGREARGWTLPVEARRADAIVLTHAHNDHVGSLPALLAGGFDGPLCATRATLEVARLVIEDGMRLQDVPGAERRDVLERFDRQKRPVAYDAMADHLSAGFSFALREAGHILGSSSVEFRMPSARIVLSGDLGRPNVPILRDPFTAWDPEPSVDLAVMECTYGDREHGAGSAGIEAELERVLTRAVAEKGRVLVPAFAIGRTQLLLWHLNALVESGRIQGLTVAIDTPMGLAVTETHERFRALWDKEALERLSRGDDPFDFERLFAVGRGSDSARLREVPGPLLVVAGSGMCTGGRIVGHLVEMLPEPSTTVLFIGYQAPGTPGRRIQEAASNGGSIRVGGHRVAVRAKVATIAGMSAHADRRELAGWLRALPGLGSVALHHGEPGAQRAFASWFGAQSVDRAPPGA